MEQSFMAKIRFLLVHMFQEELLLTLLVTAVLLWILFKQLSFYNTKTKEAAVSKKMALVYLGLIGVLWSLGRFLQ